MKKYNRTYHLPWSLGTTSDDRFVESINTILNKRIIITEKLDGENCGMTNNGVYARSHLDFTTSPWSKEVRNLHQNKIKNQLEDGLYLFGENMEGIHSIEYQNLTTYFYLFGVRDINLNFLSWDKVLEYAYLLDLETVPVLFDGIISTQDELKNIVDNCLSNGSKLGNEIEGIVVRTFNQFHSDEFHLNVMKWVRKNHVKTDEHWTKNWKKANLNYYYEN
jgi:hypothetical protein